MKLRWYIFLLFEATMLFSCQQLSPANFWQTYKSSYQLQNISDQGPWGGHHTLYWKTTVPHTFTSAELIEFAHKNGWQLVDSLSMDVINTNAWPADSWHFPFSYSDFTKDTFYPNSFPRWIQGKAMLFRFKTGLVAIEPGKDRQTDTNGYMVLTEEGTEMAVYHLWGE